MITGTGGAGRNGSLLSVGQAAQSEQVTNKNQKKEKTVLTISHAGAWDRYLLTAVEQFNKAEHDLEVKINKIFEMTALSDAFDYETKLITEIMAGKGPDIIDVTYLPYLRFIERGILTAFDELINKDKTFVLDDYYQNILNAGRFQKNLYVMPINFTTPVFVADKALLTGEGFTLKQSYTWPDFINEIKKLKKDLNNDGVPDRYPFAKAQLGLAHRSINIMDFIDWKEKKARFNSAEFIELLTLNKEILKEQLEHPEVDEAKKEEAVKRGAVVFWDDFTVSDYLAFIHARNLLKTEDIWFLLHPSLDGKKNFFHYGKLFAVNDRTKHQEQAWQFIKFLISFEMQTNPNLYGFPVNKKAAEEHLVKLKNKTAKGELKIYIGSGQVKVVNPPTEEEIAAIDNLIFRLNRSYYYDRQLERIVRPEIKRFLAGERSAEKTARVIQSKVEIYLWE